MDKLHCLNKSGNIKQTSITFTNNIVILLSSVEKSLQEKACDHFVWLVWKISCKSYVLVKYFLLFYFAFVQFILLCFHFSNVTIIFKNGNQS